MIPDQTRLLQMEYEVVEPFYLQYGFYIVGKVNKMGVIRFYNNISEVIVPLEYDQVSVLSRADHLLIAKKHNKKRIVKIFKSKIVQTSFDDEIGSDVSYNGLIEVKIDNYVGIVNRQAEEIIPVQYDILENEAYYSITYENIIMKKHGKLGVLKTTGTVSLPFEYDEIDYINLFYNIPEYYIKNNLIINTSTPIWLNTALMKVKKNNKWGLVDLVKFSAVTPCVYNEIFQRSVNIIVLKKDKGHDVIYLTKNGPKIECISTDKLKQYNKVETLEDNYAVVYKNGMVGYIDEDYTEIVPCAYDEVTPLENNVIIVLKDRKYGCYDKKGKEVIPCIYDEVTFSVDGHNIAVVKKGDLFGAINTEGKVVIPIEYKFLVDLSVLGPIMFMAIKDRLFGVLNAKNDVIVPFEYDEVYTMFGMITVIKKDKKGVFNHKGQLVVPVEYDDIKHPSMEDKSINVCKNGKWGVLNSSGQELCSPQYDKIDDYGFACNRLAVCRDNKWGFINKKGNEIIPCIYDKVIQWFEENHCEVILNGERFVIDIHGNRISII